MLHFTQLGTRVPGCLAAFGTVPLLLALGRKFKIQIVWAMFVLFSSLVSTAHFSALYARVVVLKPVQ